MQIYLFLIFFFLVKCHYFDIANPNTIQITEDEGSNSLFGTDLVFSKSSSMFYIGAPKAINLEDDKKEIGAVYVCEANKNICEEKIYPANMNDINSTTQHRPFFGFSVKEDSEDSLFICAPNLPFVSEANYFCSIYDKTTKKIKPNSEFPLLRTSNEDKIIENFGIQVEKTSQRSDHQYIINQRNFKANASNIMIVASSYAIQKNINVKNISGNNFFVNYKETRNYLIVSYSDDNLMYGSLSVFNNEFNLVQDVNITQGTIGQYFGYSGTHGKFDRSSCNSAVFGVPFYSFKPDQGAVYIFRCDISSNEFSSNPEVILGDDEEYARFGYSIANIGNFHNTGYEYLAVLAPYWYTSQPVIYIYKSNDDGIFKTYSYKLNLRKSDEKTNIFPSKLFSEFDIDHDNLNDLVLSYPVENKIQYFLGIPQVAVRGKLTFETFPNFKSCMVSLKIYNEEEQIFCKIKLTLQINIDFLTPEIIKNYLELKYSVILHEREFSFFHIDNFPKIIDGTLRITDVKGLYSEEFTVLFWYHKLIQKSILVSAQVYAESNPLECKIKCLKSETLLFTADVRPIESENETTDLPSLSVKIDKFDNILTIGSLNEGKIVLKIVYKESNPSFYPTITLKFPKYVSEISAILPTINDMNIYSGFYENNDYNIYSYKIFYHMNDTNELTMNIDFTARPTFESISTKFEICVRDEMYIYYKDSPVFASFVFDKEILIIDSYSSPKILDVVEYDEKYNSSEYAIYYGFQVRNKQNISPLKDVYLILNLPLVMKSVHIFEIKYENIPSNLQEINCTKDILKDCNENVLIFYTENIPPNSNIIVKIKLLFNRFTVNLIKNKIHKLEMFLTVRCSGNIEVINKELSITTEIRTLKEVSNLSVVFGIIGVSFFAILIIGSFGFLTLKLKLSDKLKNSFKKPIDENLIY